MGPAKIVRIARGRAVNRKAVSSECNGRCRTAKVMREQTIGGYADIVFAVYPIKKTFLLIFIPFLRKKRVPSWHPRVFFAFFVQEFFQTNVSDTQNLPRNLREIYYRDLYIEIIYTQNCLLHLEDIFIYKNIFIYISKLFIYKRIYLFMYRNYLYIENIGRIISISNKNNSNQSET